MKVSSTTCPAQGWSRKIAESMTGKRCPIATFAPTKTKK